jgi:hypothetical protein
MFKYVSMSRSNNDNGCRGRPMCGCTVSNMVRWTFSQLWKEAQLSFPQQFQTLVTLLTMPLSNLLFGKKDLH